ncbi:extracellular solute-binding protein [Thiospirochaeta perfilievii]|uniref:Extracellular solute-binding protein n=1 Tax=Thiospirochaeta perfilievii TaxID=252967 RepID=A0A5C1Q964_9SPIO|nr:extracellular solute-binding protein [Thiospirochaeta perfilievii]QEN04051.1 extracellular solute-binding protein [Thiospirochaeta perfilievii]
MKKQLEFILVFIIFSNTIFCGSNREIIESNRELPVITMAYSWEYGFKNNLKEFSDSVKNEFIIKTEENLGLNHKEKILIDASSNSVPDVFCFWSYETNLRYLADNGFLLNMDEYLEASTKYSREDFIPRFLDATKVDGINYALPHESFYGFMALNQSIFDEYNLDIPKTFNDLKEISPILNKNGITPFSMGSFRGIQDIFFLVHSPTKILMDIEMQRI